MLVIYWDYKIYSRITFMLYRDYKNYALGLQGLQGLQRQILRLHCDYKKTFGITIRLQKKSVRITKRLQKKVLGL